MSTITGLHGTTRVGDATFTPTSRDGDGSVHDAENGAFVGSVYVDKRYPYDMVTGTTTEVVTFIAQDPETYEEVGRFDTQQEAIACLVDESRKHPFAPESDDPNSLCGDCNQHEGSRYHVGEPDYRYWPD